MFKFFGYYFLTLHLHHKKSYYLIRIQEAQKHTDPALDPHNWFAESGCRPRIFMTKV
jgi:hypothetical protein